MIIDIFCTHCDGEGFAEGQVCRVCAGTGAEWVNLDDKLALDEADEEA